MKKPLTTLVIMMSSVGVTLTHAAFRMDFDNTLTANQYYVYCDGHSADRWSLTLDAGVTNEYYQDNTDNNDNNPMTCTITDKSASPDYLPSYVFFYQVDEDGKFVTYPTLNEVNDLSIRVCEDSSDTHHVTLYIDQGAAASSTTTTTTKMSWKPTVNYTPALAQQIANAVSDRLEDAISSTLEKDTEEYTYTFTSDGSYDHLSKTVLIEGEYVVHYAGEDTPQGCTDYDVGDSVAFPSNWSFSGDWEYWKNSNWPYW